MNLITRLKIKLGIICPEHLQKPYYDYDYDRWRCPVTGQPVKTETNTPASPQGTAGERE